MFENTFNPHYWDAMPFPFWSVVFFVFGSIVGSFLNVCIYRMPLELSVVNPPSHCPHCKYSIPFYLNVPLLTWLSLGGKCKSRFCYWKFQQLEKCHSQPKPPVG